MTIQQAIEKAIEGGFEASGGDMDVINGHDPQFHIDTIRRNVLDPLFWQALGKAMGWDDDSDPRIAMAQSLGGHQWLSHWHRFIDHLAEGKSIESFFESI